MFIFHSTIKTRSLITLSMQDGYNLHSSGANPNPCVCAQGVHAGRAESRRHNTHNTQKDRPTACMHQSQVLHVRIARLTSWFKNACFILEEPGTAVCRCVGAPAHHPTLGKYASVRFLAIWQLGNVTARRLGRMLSISTRPEPGPWTTRTDSSAPGQLISARMRALAVCDAAASQASTGRRQAPQPTGTTESLEFCLVRVMRPSLPVGLNELLDACKRDTMRK